MEVYRLIKWKLEKNGSHTLVKSRCTKNFWTMANIREKWEKEGYEVHVIKEKYEKV